MIEFIKNILKLPFTHIAKAGDHYFVRRLGFLGYVYLDNDDQDDYWWLSSSKSQHCKLSSFQGAKDRIKAMKENKEYMV